MTRDASLAALVPVASLCVSVAMAAGPAGETVKAIGAVAVAETSAVLSKTEFYQLLQDSLGAEIANQTRVFVDKLVLTHESLQEGFTAKKLSIRADPIKPTWSIWVVSPPSSSPTS